ncbi:hypothetical protein FACS1894187_03700 [Synergistales bacterium]|nr:hypothetical protein FACS1894187_03700 [Synergistales bacterium]
MRKFLAAIVCLSVLFAAMDIAYASPASVVEPVVKMTKPYWDDLYRLLDKAMLVNNLYNLNRKFASNGDDFYRFVKTTDKIDDVLRVVAKLPMAQRAPLLLEISAARNLVKPTEMLKLQQLIRGMDKADDIIRLAMTKGDDIADALRVAAKVGTKADDAAKVTTASGKVFPKTSAR